MRNSFARAQREYENRMPPEAPEPCSWHDWEWDEDYPNIDECPSCLSSAEDYYEMRAEDLRHGIY